MTEDNYNLFRWDNHQSVNLTGFVHIASSPWAEAFYWFIFCVFHPVTNSCAHVWMKNPSTAEKSIHSTCLWCPWLADSDQNRRKVKSSKILRVIWGPPPARLSLTHLTLRHSESACLLFLLWPLSHYFCTSVLYCPPDKDLSPTI